MQITDEMNIAKGKNLDVGNFNPVSFQNYWKAI